MLQKWVFKDLCCCHTERRIGRAPPNNSSLWCETNKDFKDMYLWHVTHLFILNNLSLHVNYCQAARNHSEPRWTFHSIISLYAGHLIEFTWRPTLDIWNLRWTCPAWPAYFVQPGKLWLTICHEESSSSGRHVSGGENFGDSTMKLLCWRHGKYCQTWCVYPKKSIP